MAEVLKNQKDDKFLDLVKKWNDEQLAADRQDSAEKFDFLNNPGQFSRLREENRDAAVEEWRMFDITTKIRCVLNQFIDFTRTPSTSQGEADGIVPFMLKSKRLEYTFEYFRNQLDHQLRHPE